MRAPRAPRRECRRAVRARHGRYVTFDPRARAVSRHRDVAWRAHDRLRLRGVPVDGPARHAVPAVDPTSSATTACGCWWTRRRTCAAQALRARRAARRRDSLHARACRPHDGPRRGAALQHADRPPMPMYGDAATLRELRRTFELRLRVERAARGAACPTCACLPIGGPFCLGRQEVVPVPVKHGHGTSWASGSGGSRI